jgi:glycerol-3-phosphate acyltransferase PlsX
MSITIALDGMGGDAAPGIVVDGAALALAQHADLSFALFGDETRLAPLLSAQPRLRERCAVHHTPDFVAGDAKPSLALRQGRNSSMRLAINAVKDGVAAAAVSAGNTGALMAMAKFVLKTLPGVDRPAIASVMPGRERPVVILDLGANVECTSENLFQFAVMGEVFARVMLGVGKPRVGLLNVGTEEHKGRSELHDAADMIAAAAPGGDFDYIGYVEGSDMPSARVDVIVTDGFTGNVALKTAEGTAGLIRGLLKEAFSYSALSRIGALFALTSMKRLQQRIDPRRANGGVFLGLNGTVIKSHGSADAISVSAAIKLAFTLADSGFTQRLVARVGASDPSSPDAARGGQTT